MKKKNNSVNFDLKFDQTHKQVETFYKYWSHFEEKSCDSFNLCQTYSSKKLIQ